MDIGIIGAGMVGGALSKAFSDAGHNVVIAAKNPASESLKNVIAKCGPSVHAGAAQDAADFGDVIVLASPWPATKEILERLSRLQGKIILDATNPILPDFSGLDRSVSSGGEAVAEWAGGAKVVKALNHIASDMMAHPKLEHGKAILFVAGDDSAAKEIVCQLLDGLGFEAEDCGALSMSVHTESLAWLYINRAMIQGKGRDFAFTVTPSASSA